MAGILDYNETQNGVNPVNPNNTPLSMWQQALMPWAAPAPQAGPAPLTPQQIAIQQAQAGTPLPQGFNPSMLGGNMAAMPHPQGFTGGMGAGMPSPTMGFGGAQPQPSTGGLNPAGLGAASTGLNMMQNSQPQPAQMQAPSMLGGGGAVQQARMGPGSAPPATSGAGAGMGGGMLNPQLLKLLMGAGNGTA